MEGTISKLKALQLNPCLEENKSIEVERLRAEYERLLSAQNQQMEYIQAENHALRTALSKSQMSEGKKDGELKHIIHEVEVGRNQVLHWKKEFQRVEQSNYALTLHLRQIDSSNGNGYRRPPDVY